MSVEVGTLKLDIAQPLAALDKLAQTADLTSATIRKGQEAANSTFAEAARQATAYSDSLKRQQDEVRAASAAVASAREELRRLTDQQKELTAAQSKTNSTTAEYQRITKELDKNRQAIVQVKAAILESTQATRTERDAVLAVQEARRQEVNAAKQVTAAAKDAAAAAKQEAAAQKEAASAASGTAGAATGLSGVIGKVGSALAGLAVIGFAKRIGSEVLEVTSDFQRMEAVLTTIFDGDDDKAQRVFAQLRQFTLKNPFEVREVTEGYVKLRNVGINPSIQQLQQLADLAAASGKSFDTVTSGLLGATTGRFAQLKQFGITAKQQGDEVALTFRGVTTVVDKSQEAISQYVLGLGALNGVAGATARIMETTGGKVTNLKDNFTELFNSIGEGTGGPVNAFIRGLTEITKKVNELLKSRKQLVAEATAAPAQDYSDSVDILFKAAIDRAKKNGMDANVAVAAVIKQQQADLAKQLVEAQKQVNFFTLDGSKEASLRQGNYRGGAEQFKADGIQAEAYLQYVKAGQKALQERAAVALKGGQDEENILGRIQALRAKIAADTKLRDETLDTKEGNAERVRLNALLKDENKLLDELLGKEEKGRKARQYSYESQLRALLAERDTLTSLAAKAAEQQADDGTARAKAVFEEGLRQVDLVEAKLKQRELDLRKAAAKVGGGAVARLGEKADGVIDGVQDRQLTALRLAAMDKYYADLYTIIKAREQRLFDLRADSDAKEIEAIDHKYDALIKANTDGIEREAIEEARQREQLALKAQQEQRRIDQEKRLQTETAVAVGQVYGRGTGVSKPQAALAEAQALLNIERKAAQDSLNNTLNKTGKEAEIEREALRAQLARIAQQQRDLDFQTKKFDFSIAKLILGDDDDGAGGEKRQKLQAALDATVGQVVNSLNEINQAQQQAAQQRAADATQRINELSANLAAEIQLNKNGSASNIQGTLDEIEQNKQIRRQALQDQRTAAKEKVVIDTLTQASSIATSVAQIIEGFSLIPIVGPALGIAASALIIGAFVASKAQAYSAASNLGSGFFRGGYTGGEKATEERGIVHGKEFVHTAEKTEIYRHSLFEPLHKGELHKIDWSGSHMQALLPDLSLPDRMRQEKAQALQIQHEHSFAPMKQDFDRLHARLEAIEATNSRMADKPDRVPLGPNRFVEVGENGSTHVKNV